MMRLILASAKGTCCFLCLECVVTQLASGLRSNVPFSGRCPWMLHLKIPHKILIWFSLFNINC